MTDSADDIYERLIGRFQHKKPDLILYLDDPYLKEAFATLIEVFAEELADIKNDYISKDDPNRVLSGRRGF